MPFQLTPLRIPNMRTDYSAENSASANLGQTLGNLPGDIRKEREDAQKQQQAIQKQQLLGEVGQGIASGTVNYKQAAGKLFQLGDAASGFDLLKLDEAATQRKAGEAATQSMGSALQGYLGGGGLGGPISRTSGSTDSALPASLVSSESGGNWGAQNNEVGAGGNVGHFGRGQFSVARLQEAADAGAIPQGTTPQQFKNSPALQQAAERWHVDDIDQTIQAKGFDRLIGQSINGVPITRDGMVAVAHLGGKGGLERFISTGGAYNPADANGTSLMDYMALGARGQRSAQADMPARGSVPVAMETGQDGYAIPGQPSMNGRTFDAITQGNRPLDPAFQSEGASQPWMGSALGPRGRQDTAAIAQAQPPMPPRRPYDLQSDVPAPGAVQAMGQMPQPVPLGGQYAAVNPNSNDAGGLAGLVAGEEARRGLPSGAGFMSPWANYGGQSQPTPADGNFNGSRLPQQPPASIVVPNPQADIPARGASPTIGMSPAAVGSPATSGATAQVQPAAGERTQPAANPVPTSELPRPTNPQEAQDYRYTKDIENKQRQVGALASALANPNLPANARGLGEIFLKDALEQSKMPDGAKEFMYAKGMGWTTAKNPAEYAAEKEKAKKNTADDDVEARQAAAARAGLKPGDAGYQGFILTGKMPREDMGPLSATDKKAILEADEAVQSSQTAIKALQDAKKLSPQALGGWGAGTKAALANNLPDWMVPDRIASPQKGEATANLDNLVTSQALAQLKSIFGAAPTEGERKILLDIQGSISQPDNIRQGIYDRAIQMAERRMAFNQQRANELRGGDFYKSPEKRSQGGGNQPPAPSQQQRQAVSTPSAAVDFLKANPGARDQFDAKYGRGAAASVLGE